MNSNDHISLNFCYSEFTASRIAEGFHIDNNIPSKYVRLNIHALVTLLLQPLRDACGHALKVNSGYRCKKLNDLVGGSKNSQHTKGQAADCAILSKLTPCNYHPDPLFLRYCPPDRSASAGVSMVIITKLTPGFQRSNPRLFAMFE